MVINKNTVPRSIAQSRALSTLSKTYNREDRITKTEMPPLPAVVLLRIGIVNSHA